MFLLHPTIAPWLVRAERGWHVALLADRDDATAVYLRALPDNEEALITMHPGPRSGPLYRWDAFLPIDTGNTVTRYAFKVLRGDMQHWLAADGRHAHLPPEDLHFRANPHDVPPAWVRDQVFYQIFPDRFARGRAPADRSAETIYGSRPYRVVQKEWGEPIDPENASNAFYGGDLEGIRQRLDYLQGELGVTALYLNPVFTAGSNHKYDTEDYYNVDPHFGGNAALIALSDALHARGMRLVLDAVVNHTGTNHPWFNRWGRHATLGAAQSPASPFRSFYAFDESGQPLGWKGHTSLPVLDFASPLVRATVYEAPDAILRHWLRPPYSIDGWRLDVIHMLGEGPGAHNNAHYVREFRRAMRAERPDAYVLGEHFSEATSWLQGEQEDGAMNYYGFAHPLRAWLLRQDIAYQPIRIDTREFERWLARSRAAIPYDNQLAQLNLLDSHDTVRFLSLLGGDTQRMQTAVTLLFSYPGVPCIYYGDEIGLEGGRDPDCRRCFDWERGRWNRALFEHFHSMARLRRTRAEWRHGAYQTLAVGDDWLAFARYTERGASIVVVNRGPDVVAQVPVVELPLRVERWREASGHAFEATPDRLACALPAGDFRILLSAGGKEDAPY
ncbi:MAG TPA: maltodextrin glucosidase [Burkholderiaceae bacterium]|nr:maltodextrin glucosidase [Burkholderiaceae bacterium]